MEKKDSRYFNCKTLSQLTQGFNLFPIFIAELLNAMVMLPKKFLNIHSLKPHG